MTNYKGYFIEDAGDGTFDILESNGDLVDGYFSSVMACQIAIDGFDDQERQS